MSRHRAIVLVVVAATASCGDSVPNSEGRSAVRDSAGVRIVHHDASSIEAPPTWTLSAEPFVVIGAGEQPDELLDGVRDIAAVSGDRVAVLDASNTLRIFDAGGRLEASWGGPGEGPGEFEYASSITALGGDTLAIWDPVAQRETRFRADEGLLGSRRVSRTDVREAIGAEGSSEASAVLADGLMLAFHLTDREGGVDELVRPTVRLFAYRPETGTVDTLGTWLEAAQVTIAISAGRSRMPALGPTWFTRAIGERSPVVCAGNEGALLVDCIDPLDGSRWSVRWDQPARLVDAAIRDSLHRAFREGMGARYPESVQDEILAELPVMDTLSYFESLHVDDRDRLWVVRSTADGRSALVFDRDGSLAARVELPRGLQIRSIADDRVYGVTRDALDVQAVRGFGIRRE